MTLREHSALAALHERAVYRSFDAPVGVRELWAARRDHLLKKMNPTKSVTPKNGPPELAQIIPTALAFPAGREGVASWVLHGELTTWTTDEAALLRALGDASEVFISIDSLGGDLGLALKLFDALRGRKVTVDIVGTAASAALILSMAGQHRRITRGGWTMLHGPFGYRGGTASELRREAARLERYADRCADVVAAATGAPRATVAQMLAGPTDNWFNSQDSLASGLVTSVYDPPTPPPSEAAS